MALEAPHNTTLHLECERKSHEEREKEKKRVLADPVEMLHNSSRKVSLQLDDNFNQFVEVVGTNIKHIQHPRERPEQR